MKLSVVIPTMNKRPLLERTLAALLAQDAGTDDWEIVVVDDGSTDDTAAFLAELAAAGAAPAGGVAAGATWGGPGPQPGLAGGRGAPGCCSWTTISWRRRGSCGPTSRCSGSKRATAPSVRRSPRPRSSTPRISITSTPAAWPSCRPGRRPGPLPRHPERRRAAGGAGRGRRLRRGLRRLRFRGHGPGLPPRGRRGALPGGAPAGAAAHPPSHPGRVPAEEADLWTRVAPAGGRAPSGTACGDAPGPGARRRGAPRRWRRVLAGRLGAGGRRAWRRLAGGGLAAGVPRCATGASTSSILACYAAGLADGDPRLPL